MSGDRCIREKYAGLVNVDFIRGGIRDSRLHAGPNTEYIIARSVQQGRTAGIVSSLGVETGTLIHIIAAAFGISALLVSSALPFNVVKYAGAAYLIHLGVKTLLTREKLGAAEAVEAKSLRLTFSQAVLVNADTHRTRDDVE